MAWGPLAGLPSPGAHPDSSPAWVSLQHLPIDSETNPHTLDPVARLQIRTTRWHGHTHTCTRVCMHKLITFPSPQGLLRPHRSLIPSPEHPSPLLASAGQQRRGRERAGPTPAALLPHCPRPSPLPGPGHAPSRLGRDTRATPKEPQLRTVSCHRSRARWCRGAGAREAPRLGWKWLSSDPLTRENWPKTRVNRKTKKSPGEGDLPVGGRGRLEGRGESEEACLSWRQGGSPS